MVVRMLGLLIVVPVTAVSIQDRDGGRRDSRARPAYLCHRSCWCGLTPVMRASSSPGPRTISHRIGECAQTQGPKHL